MTGDAIKTLGENYQNWQMIGLTIGGIVWGIMGDKKGRKSVLFGSILLYSLATIANGFVTDITQYTFSVLLPGLGLQVNWVQALHLPVKYCQKKKRGLSSAIIATSGVMGCIAAYFVFKCSGQDWRLCYFIGGGMGLALLFLRMGVLESVMYDNMKKTDAPVGNF